MEEEEWEPGNEVGLRRLRSAKCDKSVSCFTDNSQDFCEGKLTFLDFFSYLQTIFQQKLPDSTEIKCMIRGNQCNAMELLWNLIFKKDA